MGRRHQADTNPRAGSPDLPSETQDQAAKLNTGSATQASATRGRAAWLIFSLIIVSGQAFRHIVTGTLGAVPQKGLN